MFERGATDYVLKNRLSKLVPAVKRALREAEQRSHYQKQEQELRESEERHRSLVERSPEAIFVVQTDDRIVFANPAAVKLAGAASLEELIGKQARKIFRPDPWDALMDRMRRREQQEAPPAFVEQMLFQLSGGSRHAEVSVAPTVYQGKLAMQVIVHDLSDAKQAAERLRDSEALKTAILETALDGIISIDNDGRIQEWNPAAEKIFGYRRDEAMGCQVDDLILPPSVRATYKEGLTQYLLEGAVSLIGRPVELALRRSNNTEFPARLALNRMLTEDPPRFTALIQDISERKRSEAALRESEERFRMLVEGVKDYAIYMLDPEGRVTTWNSGAESIEGYSAAEVVGRSLATFFTPEDARAGLPARLLKKAETEGKTVNEGWRVRKDGSRFWSHGTITALRDEEGKLYGFSKIAHDLTKHRDAEEQIGRLNEELEQRVRERTAELEIAIKELEAFSYSVSHDLRAPLRHIVGYAGLLQSEAASKLDDSGKQHLQTIANSARNLGDLIDALLSFSRMGRTEYHRQPVELSDVVEQARQELTGEMEGRNVDWQIGPLPDVQGDPILLRQVMINLLSNALKYTRTRKQAKIEIGAVESLEDVQVFVRDNGVGFDMEFTGKLFGVFQRLHPASEFEGIGIGLANVSRIIRRHDGRVWAEGKVDAGATFYFSIPKQSKGQS
jgi:PAS domain S-box-containing protein